MAERVKMLLGVNADIFKIFSGAGGFPNLVEALTSDLQDMDVEVVPFEDGKDMAEQLSDVDIIIPAVMPVSAEMINAAPKLKAVIQAGIGLDTVDIEAATKKNVIVANEPEGSAIAMGEFGMMLILCTIKKVLDSRELMKQGIFFQPIGFELAGRTLGLVGLGRSARELIVRAKPFGMKIIGIDKFPDQVGDLGIDFQGGLDKLDYILENSDIVSIHCPANSETNGMINYDKICKMKSTAILINLARASIVNKEDFIKALKENKIMGAGFDVFWDEPMDPKDELLTLPNLFATPHIATSTIEARIRIFRTTSSNIRKALKGEIPESCVNLK
ncbi:MAG: 2-hydroxyacid dehydrogenase [Spirochaetota bacterium]|nr:2-hydroxyacid dehydrogenase [Spirochaetota bacterium]